MLVSKPHDNHNNIGDDVKNFHGTFIMGPGLYDYHGFMIITQPYFNPYSPFNF